MIIETHAHARAGLIGNPSDGYYGKTISVIVRNFAARVTLWESPELQIIPDERDVSRFTNFKALVRDVNLHGYYGGVRIVKATLKKFADYCAERGVALPERNFTIRYDTDIPTRVGLAGSSAIATATMRALMKFYGVEIPKPILPNYVLAAENDELGINAGLQDRVIQTYEGAVYMDFARELLQKNGHGHYVPLDPASLPPLYLAYDPNRSKDSGAAHNKVRVLFEAGNLEVLGVMRRFADITEAARAALARRDYDALGRLINENFDLRASIYDIAPENRRMVDVARRCGACAHFSGSGGAVLGICPDEAIFTRLKEALGGIGCTVIRPQVA
ncbi:MAG: GHMP kinase [Verrucomicrobia bacterium]|nr:GHMP kinase [Verrucomicrobiota bacterium]